MPTNYPAGYDAFPAPGATLLSSNHDDMHIDVQDGLEAVEAELGLNPSSSAATVAARFPTVSAWTNFAWAAEWTVSISRVRKFSGSADGGLAVVSVGVTRQTSNLAGSASTPATLPAGFRPDSLHYMNFWVTGQETMAVATVSTDGIISFSSLTINTGQSMYLDQTVIVIAA